MADILYIISLDIEAFLQALWLFLLCIHGFTMVRKIINFTLTIDTSSQSCF